MYYQIERLSEGSVGTIRKMGIPSYFFHIIRTYGDTFFKANPHVARLFLDLNCCIHGCKNRVTEEFNSKLKSGRLVHFRKDDFENEIIKEVVRTIIRFCKETNPTDLVWIAVDGVVPLAKMIQQRERRLRAVELKSKIQEIRQRYSSSQTEHTETVNWDSNAITPGTPFMLRLCDTIRKELPNIQKEVSVKEIFMDGVRNPGEGEQKIFNFLRKFPGKVPGVDDVIYGLDADLIILSLLHVSEGVQTSGMSLLREEQEFGKLVQTSSGDDALLRFNVSEFSKRIPVEWGGTTDLTLLKDYVVLMSLMGNDFVPHIPSIEFHSDGMERLLESYRKVGERIISHKDNTINWDALHKLFKELQPEEESILKENTTRMEQIGRKIHLGIIPFRWAEQITDPIEQEITAMDWEHYRLPDPVNIWERHWQTRYYRGITEGITEFSSNSLMIEATCDEYLRSIQWCWNYYRGIPVPKDVAFPFAGGPLLEDLASDSISLPISTTETEPTTETDIPVEAQLISVLPRESHNLLSNKAREISRKVPELFPEEYNTWYWLKRHEWQCVSKLPPIPLKRIIRLVKKHCV